MCTSFFLGLTNNTFNLTTLNDETMMRKFNILHNTYFHGNYYFFLELMEILWHKIIPWMPIYENRISFS